MPNLFDYLNFRGDISFKERGINEIDALVFSKLAALDFKGIVPAPDEGGYITLDAAARRYSAEKSGHTNTGALITPYLEPFLMNAASQRRYAGIRLSNFVDIMDDENEMQFAAMVIDTRRHIRYVVFRGTDDSITAWKENMNMSFMETVPSQIQASLFLERVSHSFSGKIAVAGHSKGGNLAVYSSASADAKLQKRITDIYNFDGPGFMPSMLESEGYINVRDRIHTVVPEDSIVGMMLERREEYRVVKSRRKGYLQHDCFMWQIKGTGFDELDNVSDKSVYIDKTISAWMNDFTPEIRKRFIDTFFDILLSTGAGTVTELTENKLNLALSTVNALRHMDELSVSMMKKVIGVLIQESRKNKKSLKDKSKKKFFKGFSYSKKDDDIA